VIVSTTTRSSSLKSDAFSSLIPPKSGEQRIEETRPQPRHTPSFSRLRFTASTTIGAFSPFLDHARYQCWRMLQVRIDRYHCGAGRDPQARQ